MAVVLQSGILSPSGSSSLDATEALQKLNSWAAAINAHDAQTAIDYTTLHFLEPTENNTLMTYYFYYIFSNQSLVFTTTDIRAYDAASMSPGQKARAEEIVENITDQSRETHIDEIITGYVLILGSMSFSGMEDLPVIDELVAVKIGSSWYMVLGS